MRSLLSFERSKCVIFLALFTFIFTTNIHSQRIYRVKKSKKIHKSTYQSERDVFKLINRERTRRGLKKLVLNSRLSSLARKHSSDMARKSYFSHRSRDGKTVDQRARSYGIRNWRGIGENLAYSHNSSDPVKRAVKSWMKSSGHRRNLLSSRWQETGIGVAVSRNGTYYFTEVFIMK